MSVDEKYLKLLDLISTRVSKDEITFSGFQSSYAHNECLAPQMLYARGDFRTIHIGIQPARWFTNHSHFLVQVSDNNSDWRELIFDGSDWGGELGTMTPVFSTTLAHTRIPFNNGSIRTLFYRARTVSKDGRMSEWSESISGNTFYIEVTDMRDDFIWNSSGNITLSGEAESGQFYYVGSGGIISITGGGNYSDYNKYSMVASGSISTSGSSPAKYLGVIFGSAAHLGAGKTATGISTIGSSFVVSSDDISNTQYTTVGTISGSTITFGSDYAQGLGYFSSSCALDSTHVISIYGGPSLDKGYVRCGSISDTTINWGAGVLFEGGTLSNGVVRVKPLSSTKFIITWRDGTNGKAIIGDVSGTTITLGTAQTFNSGNILDVDVQALSTSSFLIAYRENENAQVLYGTVSGTIMTFNAEHTVSASALVGPKLAKLGSTTALYTLGPNLYKITVNDTTCSHTSLGAFTSSSGSSDIVMLNSDTFIIAYRKDLSGRAIIGDIINNTVTLSPEYIFHTSQLEDAPWITNITSTKFAIAYTSSSNTYCIIGEKS